MLSSKKNIKPINFSRHVKSTDDYLDKKKIKELLDEESEFLKELTKGK